jgi:hypothetical protein
LNGEKYKKNSKADLYQSGVKELNGGVTSGLNPSSGRNRLSAVFGNKKIAYNVETV